MADINGTAGADLLFGAAFDDLITGGDERDFLYGGAGNDTLLGEGGNDVLFGEAGDDRLDGGAGNDDLLSTDSGNDALIGGEGNDYLFVDRLGAGDSLLLDGGSGNDRLIIQLRVVTAIDASAGDGNDTVEIFLLRNSFTLSLGAGRDLLNMFNFKSVVQGGGRIVISDFEAGSAGDRINFSDLSVSDFAGGNPNTNPFGAGYLKAVQSGADVVISASFTANGTFTQAIVLQNVLLSSLTPENLGGWTIDGSLVPPVLLAGTSAGDILRGNGGADVIDGHGGDDILEGHAGADQLNGGDGNDVLRGGAGDDELRGGIGNDSLVSGGGNDSLYGEEGDDALNVSVPFRATATSLFASGGSGRDTITVSTGPDLAGVTVDAGSGDDLVTIVSMGGAAKIALGEGRDRIDLDSFTKSAASTATIEISDFATGDNGDRLEWTNFLLRSLTVTPGLDLFANGYVRLLQSGADTLLQIDGDGGGDQFVTLITFKNNDAASFTAFNLGGFAPNGAPVAGAIITGTSDDDYLFATDGGDLIEGGDGRDLLFGFHGNDTIRGGAGNDVLYGHDGDDILEGGEGDDSFTAGRGDDLVDGGEGNDLLDDQNGAGNKGFVGGVGNDTIRFSRTSGADILVASGGEGADHFSVRITGSSGGFALDGGAGNDIFDIVGNGDITLGDGVDQLRFLESTGGMAIVHDFAVGDAGDRLSFAGLINRFTNFDPAANPFRTGHLMLVADEEGTVLIVDSDGTGLGGGFAMALLAGVDLYSLTSHNIGGYQLPFTIGTAASETFQGDALSDEFIGGGGADLFLIGYGGSDRVTGGADEDTVFVALSGFSGSSHQIDGGAGSDTLEIQGKSETTYIVLGAPAFNAHRLQISSIETIRLLSGYDASRGWNAGAPVKYDVSLHDAVTAAGTVFTLDASGLRFSESVVFSHGETDAAFHLTGGAGADTLTGSPLADRLVGGAGDDRLQGNGGGDLLDGGAGRDTFFYRASFLPAERTEASGGSDFDILYADFSAAGASGGITSSTTLAADGSVAGWFSVGQDRLLDVSGMEVLNITGTAFADEFAGGRQHDNLIGGDGDDRIAAGAGDDFLRGGMGNDWLDGGTGLDFMEGGAGDDVYMVDDVYDRVLDYAGGGTDEVRTVLATYTLGAAIENLTGQLDAGQTLIGNLLANAITGAAGADTLDGGGGNDILDGGAGADVMRGGAGDDMYAVDVAGDLVTELAGQGIDEIRTALGSKTDFTQLYILPANVENLTGTSATGQGVQGNALNNVIALGAGADLAVMDLGGDDRVSGGSGSDYFYWGAAFTNADRADGGAGNDTLGLLGSYTLAFDADDLFGIEKLALFSSGDAAAPSGYSLTMHDANLAAGQTLMVAAQSLAAGEVLSFNGAAELDGTFNIHGGKGGDTITGGAGNDVIRGNLGADMLRGGKGNDLFDYNAVAESKADAADTILDFARGDRINLGRIDADGNAANGDTKFTYLGNAAFTGAGGELRVSQHPQFGRTWVVEADVDGDKVADLTIYLVGPAGFLPLAGDFIL
jgi:Ca2+-binding RTX toxin-like protein